MSSTASTPVAEVLRAPSPHGASSAGYRARWLRRPPVELIGVVMAVIVFVAAGTSFALQVPPFHGTDERAHLGYAHAVADGHLPEIDDRPHILADATLWRDELIDDSKNDSYRTVWVANHPPLHYLLVAPLVWLSDATGRADGGLLFLRFANLAFASVGIVFTYLLAVQLTGGSRRLGLAAASLIAVLPRSHYEFSQALNDGLAFAAATAVVWAAARLLRRGHSPAGLAMVGATVAVAASARAASMIVAVVVVGVLAVARLRTASGSLRTKVGAAMVTAIGTLAPAAILVGWFFLRNVRLYGDIGASSYLMEHFGRHRKGGFVEILTDGQMWVDIYRALPTRSLLSIPATAPGTIVADIAAMIAVVGLVLVALPSRPERRREQPSLPGISRPALTLCIVVVLVVTATIAQHVAGGGLASSRYTFPALGALACLFVVGLDAVARLLPLLAIVTLTAWTAHFLPTRVATEIDRNSGPHPNDLGQGVGPILLTLSLISTVTLLAILTLTSFKRPDGQGQGAQRARHGERDVDHPGDSDVDAV